MRKFQEYSYNPKSNAQRNLAGLTHWADDFNLAFFGCRISSCHDDASGQLLCVRYSQKAGFDAADGRECGFIIFDIFGNCVIDRKFSNSKKRDKEFWIDVRNCVAYADVITETGRVAKIAQLKYDISYLEGHILSRAEGRHYWIGTDKPF